MLKNTYKPFEITKARIDLELSQEEMAILMGVGRSTIARCEEGTYKLDPVKQEMAIAVAEAYKDERADRDKIKKLLADYLIEFAYVILLIDGLIPEPSIALDTRGFLREIIRDKYKCRYRKSLMFDIFDKDETFAMKMFEKIALKHSDELNSFNEDGLTPLMEAARRRMPELCRIMCTRVDVNIKSPKSRATALHYALYPEDGRGISDKELETKLSIAVLLVNNGADVNARDLLGQDPLTLAAGLRKSAALIEMLIGQGAFVNYIAKTSPLMNAVCKNNVEGVKTLLGKGALAGLRDRNGNTALHWAIKHSSAEVFALLYLKAKNEVEGEVEDLKNRAGETILGLAQKKGNEAFLMVLEKIKNEKDGRGITRKLDLA